MLRCRPMATDVPQRQLRNDTAALLRRVEAGERLRVTVHGHPVAELVPIERPTHFANGTLIRERLAHLLPVGDGLAAQLRELDDEPVDPFA